MSLNVFYCDLDIINGKGVLVTGHGKGIVNKNPLINGEYFSNDMVKLIIENGKLFGYPGYTLNDNNLVEIEYLIYLFDEYAPNQPHTPMSISVDKYISLSQHNIQTGMLFSPPSTCDAFSEFADILKKVPNMKYIAFPFTKDENVRAKSINEMII